MTDQIAQEEPSAKEVTPAKSRWASLGSDTRLLVVTVGGTLIANILTVMIVAVAIGLERWLVAPGRTTVPEPVVIAALILLPVAMIVSLVILRLARATRQRSDLLVASLVAVPWIGLVLIVILALLGKAAGVK